MGADRRRRPGSYHQPPSWGAAPVLWRPWGLVVDSVDFPVGQTWFGTTSVTPSLCDLRQVTSLCISDASLCKRRW